MDQSLFSAYHQATQFGRWMDARFQPNLVSVIVPTYNRAHFLLDCVNSVVAQTYRPIELIVVDDGSTDESVTMLEEWQESLHFVDKLSFMFLRQRKMGANAARNRGLIESNGEFVQLLDSDDVLLPTKLERAANLLREQATDLCYCPVRFRDAELREIPGTFGSRGSGTDADITRYLWQTMGPLYRRDVVFRVGPWLERIFYADDWDYASRVKLHGFKISFDPVAGGYLRVYPRPERKGRPERLAELRDYSTAYQHVLSVAKGLGRLSPTVRNRLARRFYLTALQLGALGESEIRSECLSTVKALMSPFSPLRIASRISAYFKAHSLDATFAYLIERITF